MRLGIRAKNRCDTRTDNLIVFDEDPRLIGPELESAIERAIQLFYWTGAPEEYSRRCNRYRSSLNELPSDRLSRVFQSDKSSR